MRVFALLLSSLVVPVFGQTSQVEVPIEFRRQVTNLQYNKDGTVGLIRLSKPIVNDATLSELAQFPHLEYLAIVAPQVTDAGFRNVSTLRKLQTLFVSETPISSASLSVFRELTNITHLALTSTKLDDTAGGALLALQQLKVLSLEETQCGNNTLESVARLPALECLLMDETKVSDEGLHALVQSRQLVMLSLNETGITGEGLKPLAKVSTLKHLSVCGNPLSAAGIDALAVMQQLEILEVYNCGLTSGVLERLKQALPKTNIFHQATGVGSVDNIELFTDRQNASPKADVLPEIRERKEVVPDFQRHVIPLLGRLGCNGRSCHGSFQGRGGFRLSMFGYDFAPDHKALRERVTLDTPTESLIVKKPTSAEIHEGGQRFETGSWQQDVLVRWISGGAAGRPESAPSFIRLEVTPPEIDFERDNQTVQLKVVSVWSNGLREDVTSLSRFEPLDDAVADINEDGRVTSIRSGATHVIVYYDNGVVSVPVIRPVSDQSGPDFPDVAAPTEIDRLVVCKLRKLGIVPANTCSDGEFLRRVSLDLIGTLPQPDQVRKFAEDTRSDKRELLVEELLEHPAYVKWWTTRLCDLTGSNAGYLGNTEMASVVAAQWRDWIERRVKENVGWHRIVQDILTSKSRPRSESYRDYISRQSVFTRAKERQADFAALGNPMPHYWYRDNISVPSDKALSFGYIFMGTRLDCAQCHKHPFDRWSKHDFEQFTQFFTRIKRGLAPDAVSRNLRYREFLGVPWKLNTAALRRQSYLRIAAEGRAIPWNEIYIAPPGAKPQSARFPGGIELDLNTVEDPTKLLARWLVEEPHRYLARAFVNRIWAVYFGRGIVAPTDDLNLANPPSNAPLLDYLTQAFVDHDYDMKWLHRTILRSRTYQLSWKATHSGLHDHAHNSHAEIRRLPAEVVVDAIMQATAGTKRIRSIAKDVDARKINQQPRSYQTRSIDYSLLVFGKPLRSVNCDCERVDSPALPQALYIRNDEEILQMLDRPDGWIAEVQRLESPPKDPTQWIDEAWLRTLSRHPTTAETVRCRQYFEQQDTFAEGLRDLLWALVNTQEFITNH